MKTLEGWCVLWIRAGNCYPSMTANIASKELAESQANKILANGGRVLAVCAEADLCKLSEVCFPREVKLVQVVSLED